MPYVKARAGEGKTVIYTDDKGVEWFHKGGSPAWRNNNPGNIVKSDFANNHGAIGFAGRFACFPDRATGKSAISALLRGNSYKDLSIEDGITKYAPPVENDTESYKKTLKKLTGLDLDLTLGDLTDAQMSKVADAIEVVEGSIPGTITQGGVQSEERGSPSAFSLRGMSEEQLYEHLKRAWKRAQERFGLTGDAVYDFQEENGRVNLIGARGLDADTLSPRENRSTAWDDSMFVVYKDDSGARCVHTFYLSTEPNDVTEEGKKHVSTLKHGMHRYFISYHHISSTYKALEEYLESYAGKDYKYRALKPHASGVTTFLDTNHDQKQDPDEKEIADNEINIHYGGKKDEPTGWSHGCQVLKGPKAYRDFIELVESDTSIIGTIDNELSAKPTKDGARYVIYLLIEGTFLAPPAVGFPIAGKDAAAHYALNEGGEGGFFPIGSNNFWHGGAHLDAGKDAVVAIADGEVIAYRVNEKPIDVTLGEEKLPLSSSFVLIKHEHATPKGEKITLYSLYMHLLPLSAYDEAQKKAPPALFKKHTFKVKTTEDGRGLNVRSPADKATVLGVIPKDAHFQVVGGANAAWDKAKSYSLVSYEGLSGYAYLKDRAKIISGNTYQCTSSEDWPAAAKMGLNVREAGKGTRVLKVAPAGEELKFKKPNEVAPGGAVAAGWHELEAGGWVYVRGGDSPTLTHEFKLEPEAYDKVQSCKIPITGGSVVGYPGPYLARPATVHFEVFSGDAGFMKNPKGDKGGQDVLQIPAGKTFKKRKAPTADVTVELPVGTRLALLEEAKTDAQYRKVAAAEIAGWAKRSEVGAYNATGRFYTLEADLASLTTEPGGGGETIAVGAKKGDKLIFLDQQGETDRKVLATLAKAEQDKRTGWAKRADLGDWSSSKKRYILEAPLAALYTDDPESGSTFDEDAGTNEEEIFTDALPVSSPAVAKDKQGKLWQEVEFSPGERGYIKREGDGVKLLSAFDWPGWKQVEEAGESSKDGLCDAAELVKLVDENGDGSVTSVEIKKALTNPKVAARLRRVATAHPTEWAGEVVGLERLEGPPWHLTKEVIDATKDYIKELGFWADVKDLPAKDKVWHFHPIGVIEQLRALTTGAEVPVPVEKKVEAVKPETEPKKKADPTRPKPEQTKPLPEKNAKLVCPRRSVDDLVAFCHATMIENAKGKDVAYMRDKLEVSWLEMLVPGKALIDVIEAYWRWYTLVKPGGPWDYKRHLYKTYGEWACDFPQKIHFNFDVWSNIHYGYLGLAAGFSRADLLDGAGLAQLMAGTVPDGYWRRRLATLGDADVFRALDDPADQEAIKVGFELWEKFKTGVTKDQLKSAAEAHAKSLQVTLCEAQKPPENKPPPPSSGKSRPLPLEGSVGAGGDNFKKDVKAVRERLRELGFDWIEVKETSDDTFVAAIKLFQTIKGGNQKTTGDGKIDKDGDTHKWLQAKNAPRWQVMTATGVGIDNRERADTNDTHDYCASWLDEAILAAGRHYEQNYRASHKGASPIGINDASLPRGGDTKDHAGHEGGLDVDVYLPRTDGATGGITYEGALYDQDAARAILKAFRAQKLINRVYFNDPALIKEGLCTFTKGHANHIHVGVKAPARED